MQVTKLDRDRTDDFSARVEEWLRKHIPDLADAEVTDCSAPSGTGLSGETYIVSTRSTATGQQRKVVLRKDVQEQQTNPQSSFANLLTLQTFLGGIDGVAVPTVLGIEPSPEVIGTQFFVMEFVEGAIPADVPSYAESGWVRDASPSRRAALWTSGIDFLVRLHGIDVDREELRGLQFPAEGADDVERCLEHSVALFRREADGHVSATCEEAITWLRENRPAAGRRCISWGDARIGNMIWRDDACVAAVDWEMGSLACPGVDLGWWSFFHRWSTTGQGNPELEGMCVGRELAALYAARGGDAIDDITYYEVLATVRGLSIWLRTYKAMVPGGKAADALHDSVHIVTVLRSLLDGDS